MHDLALRVAVVRATANSPEVAGEPNSGIPGG